MDSCGDRITNTETFEAFELDEYGNHGVLTGINGQLSASLLDDE